MGCLMPISSKLSFQGKLLMKSPAPSGPYIWCAFESISRYACNFRSVQVLQVVRRETQVKIHLNKEEQTIF
jgi:hypothetical protein